MTSISAINNPVPKTGTSGTSGTPPERPLRVRNSGTETAETSSNKVVADKEPKDEAVNSTVNLRKAIEKLSEFVQPVTSDILFSMDEDTGTSVVKVVDRVTKEVIRQIPSEEAIDIAKALDKLQGLLIRQKA